jgi:Protein of unknown function (DUF3108)
MWQRLIFTGLCIIGLPTAALAFSFPERLEFNVYAFGIYAGKAVQEASLAGGRLQIVHTAVSADWMKWIYKVDDRIVSLVGTSPKDTVGLPVKFTEKIYEGRPRYDKEVYFDFKTMKATVNDLKEKRTTIHDITTKTYDSLSSFYAVRNARLTIGQSIFIDVFDGKRLHSTEVQVLRKERLKVKAGEFNTLVVKPIMKTKGIFEKTGDVFIWLSDDDRRLPVKMSSAAKIGAVTAELAAFK